MPKPLPRFRKGDVLKADDLTSLKEAIERQRIDPGQSSGISVQETPSGTALRAVKVNGAYLCQANGAITKRSGATLGKGSVTLQGYNPGLGAFGSGALYSLNVNYDVLNASSTAMTSGNGIDTGMYCWIQQDQDGNWWVSPLECA
jgi:hypothetical protein